MPVEGFFRIGQIRIMGSRLKEKVEELNAERLRKGFPVLTGVDDRPDQFMEHYADGTKVLLTIDDDLNVTRTKM